MDKTEPDSATTSIPAADTDNGNEDEITSLSKKKIAASDIAEQQDGITDQADPNSKSTENGTAVKDERETNTSPTTQRTSYKNHPPKVRNNSKFDPSVRAIPEDAQKIAQEIRNLAEFYFGDTNLKTDKHLMDLTEGPTNLPVKVSHVHTFKRMRVFQYTAVIAALRDSKFLDISGPEGLEEIRRKVPYDPNKEDRSAPRTIYAKGFGEETATTQFDVEAFFAQYGATDVVRLRRTEDKTFKGSVWVIFQDEKTAQDFLALDPKPLWQGKHELKIISKEGYEKDKTDGIREGDVKPNASRPYRGRENGGKFRGNRDRRDRGDRDPDDWKKRREDDQKSGFRDSRRDRDNRSGGGRGRGRGSDRGRRNNDRNEERKDRDRVEPKAKVENTEQHQLIKSEDVGPGKKRAREDDAEVENALAKKLDQKVEVGTNA